MDDGTEDREAYLGRLLQRLFALKKELAEEGAEEKVSDYAEKVRTAHKLKQEYKRMTGVYPHLPPYHDAGLAEPGT